MRRRCPPPAGGVTIPPPEAMADAEFSVIGGAGKPAIDLTGVGLGVANPIAGGVNAPLIEAGPDNVGFTYLGSGRLRYDGANRRFLITGSISGFGDAEVFFRSHLAVMINTVGLTQSGSNSIWQGDELRDLTARVVRLLRTGDIVELAVIQPAGAADLSIETLQLTIR